MNEPTLGCILHSFFEDHLKVQKGLRPTSVTSYADALRLFLCFVAHTCRRKLSRLAVSDLTSDRVLEFLRHVENERHNCVANRNHRLAALRSLFEYVASSKPEALEKHNGSPPSPTNVPHRRQPTFWSVMRSSLSLLAYRPWDPWLCGTERCSFSCTIQALASKR